jgi:hypothetical protein
MLEKLKIETEDITSFKNLCEDLERVAGLFQLQGPTNKTGPQSATDL